MFKFLKQKSSKNSKKHQVNTDGLRDNIDTMVGGMDPTTLLGLVDSRYPSDPMKEAYNRKAWRESCYTSTVDLPNLPDTVSLRSLSKRSSIASSSESLASSSSEENVIRLKNGFQVVFSQNIKKNRVEIRVYRDGRLLKRQEVVYHLSLAQKYQELIKQHQQMELTV
ncbi:hypothetical protein K7432_013486 [Basidiobolus ranarum]|uniref:Uncharacterized protein n=1 Tax=Basidiobolus ranarum TaxID=34480 RepID=A0ABR2VR54_9FUNG